MKARLTIGLLLVILLIGGWRALPSAYAQDQQCFPETGKCVSGRFLQFWQQHGGLAVFGFPLTDQFEQAGRQVQYFERQRFELHTENQPPYDVLLGRLGDEVLRQHGIDWMTQPRSPGGVAGCYYFAETQHNVCNQQLGVGFLNYWVTHGLEFDGQAGTSYAESLALFGLPLTEPYQYTDSEGHTYQAQWFERARFEWHPENANPYKVLLGRLGAEVLTPSTPPTSGENAAAVQTVVNYYTAIAQQNYEQAYRTWANNGAASGQSLEQFQQGFANTVQTQIRLGAVPSGAPASSVTVPITIESVVNDPSVPTLGQRVQVFAGTYTLQPAAGQTPTGYVIASANIAEVNNPQLPPNDLSSPSQVLQTYYDAINQRMFAHAYTLWDNFGAASGQSFAQFQQGFANTAHVTINLGTPQEQGAAGSLYATVPIVIFATQRDQTQQTFCGTYDLRRANLPPFDQLGWQIERATIVQTANVQPGSSEANQLLNGGCPAQ